MIQSTVIIEYNEFIVIYFIFLICLYFYADFYTLGKSIQDLLLNVQVIRTRESSAFYFYYYYIIIFIFFERRHFFSLFN